jgi:hypothetical protein
MITEWKPISRAQEQFLGLPDTIKEAFFGGSAGPGKSECLMMYPIVKEYIKYPRFKALFMRRTYPELKQEIIPRSRELYGAFGGKFNKNDLVWEFPSGALVYFGHCEHEDDVHKYDSMEINLFLPDELESFTEYQYIYIGFTRVRTSIQGLPAIIRAAGMPGGIGHTWVRNRFIKPEPKGSKLIIGKGGNKRIFIFSTLADNPKIDPNYSNSLEALPEAERRAKKFGDWSSYEGQVFEEFRDRHIPDEPDNALHVIAPFDIPSWWPRIFVIDWGFRAMTWVGYGAISPDKRVYVYRERTFIKQKIEDWGSVVKADVDLENPRVIKICKSAGDSHGQEHTIHEQVETAIGRPVELTKNSHGSRIAGKMLLHEYLRWRAIIAAPKAAKDTYNEEMSLWIRRSYGDESQKSYLDRFKEPEPETNLPKLQIFDTCTALIDSIKACVYDKTIKEDVASFDGDDAYDGIRYMIDAADRYFADSESEMNKVKDQQKLVDEFAETQDWNRLFWRARAMEKSLANSNFGAIRRYHARTH